MGNWITSIENWFRGSRNETLEIDDRGNSWYYVDGTDVYSNVLRNLEFSCNHPILTPALLFISNLFAQAKFKVINKDTGKEVPNHFIIDLLSYPNAYQRKIDFLEQLQFLKIAQGRIAIYVKRGIGVTQPDSLFLLSEELIKYPEDFSFKYNFRSQSKSYFDQKIIYDENGMNLSIPLRDILWLHDLPAVTDTKNNLLNASRIDGLRQTLKNTYDSLIAKNIILKSNGKEMLSAKGDGFPFGKEEQDRAKEIWNSRYGLGSGRSRLYLTKANVDWKSLHIALRDLGLDESTKVDGNIIYTALHIPPDVLSIDRKKTTYNNYRESLSSFIQNDIQSMLNDFTESISTLIPEKNLILVGTYEHLPTMQFLKKREYEAARTQAEALLKLRLAGIPDEMALELVGLPTNTELLSLEELNEYTSTPTSNQSNESESGQEREGGN